MTAERLAAKIVGIDPGISGAVAGLAIARAGGMIRHRLLDTDDAAACAAETLQADLVVLEAQQPSPQQGVGSAFSLGRSYGYWLGLLAAAPPRLLRTPHPAVWRGAFGLKSKQDGIAMVRELLDDPCPPLTHDEADAILLAWWGWRTVLCQNR